MDNANAGSLAERASVRRRVLKTGKIELRNKTVVDCAVRNLSRTGARLQVADSHWVPEHFVLVIPSEGLRQTCRVQWRSAVDLGVEFEQSE